MPISAYEALRSFQETSLSRIMNAVKGAAPFGVISASRGENSPAENKARTVQLGQNLQRAGYGYVRTKGGYPETDRRTGEKIPGEELSFFVFGISRNVVDNENRLLTVLLKEGQRFQQEAILYKAANEREVRPYDCATGEKFNSLGDDITFQQIEDYWTRLRSGTKAARQKFTVTPERPKQEKPPRRLP